MHPPYSREELVYQLKSHVGVGGRRYTFSPPFNARARAGGGGGGVGGGHVESLLSAVDGGLATWHFEASQQDASLHNRISHLNTFPQKRRGKGFSIGVNSMRKASSLVANTMGKEFRLVIKSISAKAPRNRPGAAHSEKSEYSDYVG